MAFSYLIVKETDSDQLVLGIAGWASGDLKNSSVVLDEPMNH